MLKTSIWFKVVLGPPCPVAENPPFNAEDVGLIPDWGATIPHPMRQLSPHTTLLSPYATSRESV